MCIQSNNHNYLMIIVIITAPSILTPFFYNCFCEQLFNPVSLNAGLYPQCIFTNMDFFVDKIKSRFTYMFPVRLYPGSRAGGVQTFALFYEVISKHVDVLGNVPPRMSGKWMVLHDSNFTPLPALSH